jgi:hypothetical protein
MSGIINSTKDSQLNIKLIGYAVALLLVISFASSYLWHWGGDDAVAVAAPVEETPTSEPTQQPTVEATPTAIVIERPVLATVEVTREVEVTRQVSTYVSVPVEVTRVITHTVTMYEPTPTAIPLASGVVEICVRVEGAREIYVGGVGVVSDSCSTFAFGTGQTSIPVQVNK